MVNRADALHPSLPWSDFYLQQLQLTSSGEEHVGELDSSEHEEPSAPVKVVLDGKQRLIGLDEGQPCQQGTAGREPVSKFAFCVSPRNVMTLLVVVSTWQGGRGYKGQMSLP